MTNTASPFARQVLIDGATTTVGRVYTITGTDAKGATISEDLNGTGAGNFTSTSVNYYKTVTSITSTGAGGGAHTAGTGASVELTLGGSLAAAGTVTNAKT